MNKLLILSVLVLVILADSCGGNCPSGNCPTCFCGTSKNVVDIGTWCAKYGWNQACCKCIVSHESGGNGNAVGHNTDGSNDVGLWQINTVRKYSNLDELGTVQRRRGSMRPHSEPQLCH